MTLDTEVAVLIEMEMVEEGVGEEEDGFEDDWASTTARNASPRRKTAARERE
jgi:hypothetical protein